MPLTLVTGPANAGKVSLLLDRYQAALPSEPLLIVPNGSDVDGVERDLLERSPALLGGWIGTFDDLFERIARAGEGARPALADTERGLLLRRVIAEASLNGLSASAASGGFAESLGAIVAELEAGLADPGTLEGHLRELVSAYRAELDRLGVSDREGRRAAAAERVSSRLDAWDGSPLFAYGFTDLTGAQWRLLQALAARAEVTVSLPYEPGRAAFASLERTAGDLAGLAAGRIEELPPRWGEHAHAALAHLERRLFADAAGAGAEPPLLEGAIRWLEGAGSRGALELVGDELLSLVRSGTPLETIAVVCPSLERWRAPLETVFGTLGIPHAVEGPIPLGHTAFGQALLSLLRFAWLGGGRRELFGHLRSPYSGLARAHADFLEGRLRGRAVQDANIEEETLKLRGGPLPHLDLLRAASGPVEGVHELADAMARAAHGVNSPPVGEGSQVDLRAREALVRALGELAAWEGRGENLSEEDVVAALERTTVILPGGGEPGRVAVLDLLRARTRRFDVVFVLGLEEGSLPRRAQPSPFLDDDARRELERVSRARLARPEQVSRERYLFYAACTRASRRLVLVREAASDDGGPRQPSPFWEETRLLFDPDEVARWTRRRGLSALTWPLEGAPSERERVRALAALAATDAESARAVAGANGWERRLDRALAAFLRPTGLTHPLALEGLAARTSFGVTELETFADCSSMWFVDRVISPRTIDARVDARLRGSVAHTTLNRFFTRLPKQLGCDRVEPERLDEALAFLRECLEEAVAGVRLDLTVLQRLELTGGLWLDLEASVRAEAELASPLVPRRFEVGFGSERSAPELQRGLDLGGFTLSGKIDRIDVDPFSARGIVQDYKSGKTAHSAAKIESELRLQIPLYLLVLRDLVGIEPLGGVYRALAGKREARGLLRAGAREDGVPGFAANDYLEEDEFWGQIDLAQERARGMVARIRAGDVRHDPRVPGCPDWCELGPMCRVARG
ncbi:MAG: PD-(D/E)XK nuclease family protein [Actinobacteria bacterium]|nr:PD-(D/E)XK nuclease family protein [Actinomycetota bacterium]